MSPTRTCDTSFEPVSPISYFADRKLRKRNLGGTARAHLFDLHLGFRVDQTNRISFLIEPSTTRIKATTPR